MSQLQTQPLNFEKLGNVPAGIHLPEVVVYEHRDYQGWEFRTNLDVVYTGDEKNDKISSIIVVSGKWQFYIDANFQYPTGGVLGPGYYAYVGDYGLCNDCISSYQCVEY
jgi:hypothetical protein